MIAISKCNHDLHFRKPVNKNAAKVFFGGFDYEPCKKVLTSDSSIPLPVRKARKNELCNPSFEDLTGIKFGRFVVIGKFALGKERGWVVKCACGTYSIRGKRAIKNPANNKDCCECCRHLEYLRDKSYWEKNPSIKKERND